MWHSKFQQVWLPWQGEKMENKTAAEVFKYYFGDLCLTVGFNEIVVITKYFYNI